MRSIFINDWLKTSSLPQRTIQLACLALIATLGSDGCSSLMAERKMAETATRRFHEQLKSGDADAIYAAAAPEFKTSVDHNMFVGHLVRVRRKMGSCPEPRETGSSVNVDSRGLTVTIFESTECQAGQLNETFVWKLNAGVTKLFAYQTSSPVLSVD
jgi:hypothetical protein